MNDTDALLKYILRIGDNALILAQRLIELVAHGPELEEELANANFALDYLGQARMLYSYAGELDGTGRCEDDFAFMRSERDFCNFQLVELPNGHFGDTLVRSFLFDSFYCLQLDALQRCRDPRIAEIATRAEREIRYHQRHNRQWMRYLGDGTDESHDRVQRSIDDLWRYTGEFFAGDEVDDIIQKVYAGPNLETLREEWMESVTMVLRDATLQTPADQWMVSGSREGLHSEHFGPLIAEMQTLQRSYPGLSW